MSITWRLLTWMAQRRMLARKREMRRPTHTGSGNSGSQSQGSLNLDSGHHDVKVSCVTTYTL